MDMELTYIYHSGFALSGDGFTVIMDYYRDSEDGQAQSDLNRLMDGTFSNQEAGMPEAARPSSESWIITVIRRMDRRSRI